jgi:hypothetical protein
MCMSKPKGPSADQIALEKEQLAAIERRKESNEAEKQRVGQMDVKRESARRRGKGVGGLYGNSRAGFGVAGGSMLKKVG